MSRYMQRTLDGGLIVGVKGKSLDEVRSLFAKKPSDSGPTGVNEINFFGCNVANSPSKMMTFEKLFGAKKVSGYTWSVGTQPVSVTLHKGTDEATARKTLAGCWNQRTRLSHDYCARELTISPTP